MAAHHGPVPTSVLARHLQIVLGDRSSLSRGTDFGVFSLTTWCLSDLGAKHAFLRAGLGWGGMPLHAVADDIAAGALVPIEVDELGGAPLVMRMVALLPARHASRPDGG